MRTRKMSVCILTVLLCMGLWSAPWAVAAEKPQYGGILQVAVAGDFPSLDMHQETTFIVVHPMSPMYNTLIQFDPHNTYKLTGAPLAARPCGAPG